MKTTTMRTVQLILCWLLLVSVQATRRPVITTTPHFTERPRSYPTHFDTRRICGQSDICSCDASKNVGKMIRCKGQNCFCDDICEENGDCCADYQSKEVIPPDPIGRPWIKSVISCVFQARINQENLFYVINKCPEHETDINIRNRCHWGDKSFEIFGNPIEIPVYGKKSKFLYRNIYCSICNEEYDVKFMKPKGICPPPTPLDVPDHLENATQEVKSAHNSLLMNASTETQCQVTELTLPNWNSTECTPKTSRPRSPSTGWCPRSNNTRDAELCKNYTSMVSDTFGSVYKNWHCANCHRKADYLSCGVPPQIQYSSFDTKQIPFINIPGDFSTGKVKYRPISVLFSVNGKGKSSSIVEVEQTEVALKTELKKMRCPAGQLSLANSCFDIYCGKGRIFRNGKCAPKNPKAKQLSEFKNPGKMFAHYNVTNISTEYVHVFETANCKVVVLDHTRYKIHENTTLSIHGTDIILNDTYYKNITINGTSFIQACVPDQFFSENITTEVNRTFPIFSVKFDETQALVSLVGQIISIVSLAILIINYSVFRALRNIPGMCIMSLAVALFFAQLLFVTGIAQVEERELCYAIGAAIHYFFLAAFFWMNVIAYDLCSVFACTKGHSEPKTVLRFACYSCYGWVLPLLVVAAAIVIDIYGDDIDTGDFEIVPKYANGLCFITNRDSLLIFFVVPAGVLTVANFVLFFVTVWGIHKAMKTARLFHQAKQKQCTLLLYMKLAAIMGLTWIFGFLQSLTDAIWATYIFIVMNSLQGLFICLAFVCTKKVLRLLKAKCKRKSKPSTTKLTTSESQKPFLTSQSNDYPHTQLTIMQMETSL